MSRRLLRPASCAIPIATNWLHRVSLRALRPDPCSLASPSNSCLGTSLSSCANTVLLCATDLDLLCSDWFSQNTILAAQDDPSPLSLPC